MPKPLTRDQVASLIVRSALRTAHAPLRLTDHNQLATFAHIKLNDIVPRYKLTGQARFKYGLAHAAKGLDLTDILPPGTITLGEVANIIALQLPVRLFRCLDDIETHIYRTRGTGKCRIDKTDLVELTF
jgi:hypothetical protein